MKESETKEVLLDKLIGIQDLEAAKPIDKMNPDLIVECSEYIIELTGEELPSDDILEKKKQRMMQRLFGRDDHSPRLRKGLLRKLLIAAIVVILIVAMSISMMPLGTNDESLLQRMSYFFLHKDSGYHVDYDNYMTLISGDEIKEYTTVRQFIRKTHLDILVPTELPKGISVQKVRAYFEYTIGSPAIIFVTNDPSVYSVTAYLGKELDVADTMEKTERIGAYACGFSIAPDWCQCSFNYNGNGYTLTAKTYEELVLILNNMKGSLEK